MKRNGNSLNHIYRYIISVIILGLVLIIYPWLLNNLVENDLFKNPINIGAITVLALAIGFLIYQGGNYALRRTYSLFSVGVGFKNEIAILGAIFLFFILLTVMVIYYKLSVALFIATIGFVFLFIALGYFLTVGSTIQSIKNGKVTLKMIVQETSGNTRLKIIHNLEWYQTTDKDYRFKATNGSELVIPIGKVEEIVKP